MLTVKTTQAVNPEFAKTLDTNGLREHFLSEGLFAEGEIRLNYTHYDRMIVGAAVPNGASLTLDHVAECGTESILDRREMGVVNIGEEGTVSAAGTDYVLNRGDVLYLPKRCWCGYFLR